MTLPPSPPVKKLRGSLVTALAVGAIAGGAAGFWAGRVFPDREIIEKRTRVAVASAAAGAPAPLHPGVNAGGTARPAAAIKIDPAADLRISMRDIFAIADPISRIEAMRGLIRGLPRERWPEVFDAIEKMGSDQEFEDNPNALMVALGTFETVISEIASQAPEAFLSDLLKKNADQAGTDSFGAVLRAWASRDLAAAVDFFNRSILPLKPDEQRDAAKQLAREFAKSDAEGAFAWIKALPKEVQSDAAHDAFQTLSHVNSAKAAEILVSHDEIPDRPNVATAIAEGWARTEPAKAFEWATTLPGELSKPALSAAVAKWAEADYAQALARVNQLDPAVRGAGLPGLADHAPEEAMPGLAAQLGAQPESDDRTSAALTLAHRWAEKDPTAASQWLAAEAPGPMRDSAIQGFALQLIDSDPASAFEWVAVMSGAEARVKSLDEGIKQWVEKDPAAARDWVLNSPRLNPPDRERLLLRTGR